VYVYLSKILPIFVMPLTIGLILGFVALVLMRRSNHKSAAVCIVLAIAVVWFSATPLVAEQFYRNLEARYPPIPVTKVPQAGCIILLGGVVAPPVPPRVDADYTEAVDRLFKATELYRAGKARWLIVSAGNQPWSASPWAEADLLRDQLMAWGVPKESIFLEGSSRNTRENAVYSKNAIDSIGCGTSLLVTSAAHMPRALAAFKSVGADVFPVSADVRITERAVPGMMEFFPNAAALAMTSEAIREWIGWWIYRFQGWI
jgi:uncharacterized SAM-binding protein YcdF (DUF218 family)